MGENVCSSLETCEAVLRAIFIANFGGLVAITLGIDNTAAPTLREALPRATAALARLGLLLLKDPHTSAVVPRGRGTLGGYGTSREGQLGFKRSFGSWPVATRCQAKLTTKDGRLRRLIAKPRTTPRH
jgi:hypothetical protein